MFCAQPSSWCGIEQRSDTGGSGPIGGWLLYGSEQLMQQRHRDTLVEPMEATIPDAHPLPVSRHIFQAKLSPRMTSPRQVPRTRLIDQMRSAQGAALVLVRGPAGFGKTTAMLQYYVQSKGRGVAVGWLTLDHADNDLVRFLRYLAEAFREIDPSISSAAASMQIGCEGEDAVTELLGHLSSFQGQYILFLDDFEAIESPVVLGLLQRIIEYLPENGQLVVGSRVLPELGIGRLRVLGRLTEVDTAQLRFSPVETAAFLRYQGGFALRDADIQRLQQRTEGWPAALWLVSLALRGRVDLQGFIDSFDGSNTAMAEYLLEDVLSRQDARIRHFLVLTSVLQEISAPLCDALLGCSDSAEILRFIERANLFLIPQDEDRQWYRYHPLFRGFLRVQLQHTDPQAVPLLHLRAARWWDLAGRAVQAIEHALLADEPDYLLSLLNAHLQDLLWRGRARTLARWYEQLPAAVRRKLMLEQKLDFSWSLILTHRYDDSFKLLGPSAGSSFVRETPFEVEVRAQRAFIMAMTDRVKESSQLWLSCVPMMDAMRPFAYAILGASLGHCLVAENRFEEARQFLEHARRRSLEAGQSFITPMALCQEGAIDFAQGRLRAAIAAFRVALAGVDPIQHVAGNAVAAAFLAEALYETDQRDEAERLLTAYMPLLKEAAAPDQLITSFLVLTRIALSRGLRAQALEYLEALEEMGHRKALLRLVASARLERVRLALLDGQGAAAQAYLAAASEVHIWKPFDGLVMHANDVDTPFLADVRWRIHSGKAESAVPMLKDALRTAERTHRHRYALKLSLLLALALDGAGQQAAGLRRMRDALEFAAREGFVRSVLDEGEGLLLRVAELRERSGDMAPGMAAFVDQLLAPAGPACEAVSSEPRAPAENLQGILSARELQVLRLLADGLRNREIAERIFVSETTVKAHLRSINLKLGAQNRTHAIALARQMRLVT